MAREPFCLGKLLPQEADRLVWRINCSLEASIESLIGFRNTEQNGSLPGICPTSCFLRFSAPGNRLQL